MTKIPLPFTDAFLLLTPAGAGGAAMVLILILAVAALVLLYRYELRLVRRSLAVLLLALRLAVLVFLLLVVGFQPIVGRSVGEELPGRVLVAVDRSASMDITDPQRPAVDKLRLVRAFKLAEDLGSADLLADWIRQYETQKNPTFLSDPDARRRHDEVCRRVDALTRTQISRKLLTADGLRLVEAIAARHRVEVQGFDQEAWDVPAERIEELFAPEAVRPADKRNGTDLRLPLLHALERSGPAEEKMLGVVLLTDGRHNWGPSPVAKAMELGQQSVPIYPIALGAAQAPPDIAVAGVKAPPAVFKNVDTPVEARVKISGLPRQEVIVELQRPGQEPLQESIAHDGKDGYHTVRFQVKLDQVGAQALAVTVKPVAGEIRTDNNSRTAVVNVADDKAKVLLVDGEARWEYHYLANALARDPSVKLGSVLFAQPRVELIAEEELQKIGNPARTLPEKPDALADYDCIILGDVSPVQLPPGERTRLERYVADRGGTLVIIAGKRWMPLAFTRLEDRPAPDAGDPLLKLLPIQDPEAIHPVRGFPVALTAEGRLTPFLQLSPTASDNLGDWAKLREHYWGAIGKTKPGATALAFVPGDEPGPEKDRALMARHHYGFGRVLYVGLESTWRWRYKVGDTLHHRFWGQVVRWAAADKPLVAGNDRVRFGTRDPVYRQGEEVDVVVRLGEDVRPLGAGALAGARILRQAAPGKEEAVALVPLAPREAQPRVLEGRLRDLPAGQYAVELVIPDLADAIDEGQAQKPRAMFTVTAPDSEEMVELSTNQPLLEELAAKSGGKVFAPENAQDLVDLLTHKASVRWHHTETRLWEWWPTLGLFLLLLTVEWVARKWAGLP
jgi:hypothetical protein